MMLKETFLNELNKAIVHKDTYFVFEQTVFGLPNGQTIIIENPSNEYYIYYDMLLDDVCRFINNQLIVINSCKRGNDVSVITMKFTSENNSLRYGHRLRSHKLSGRLMRYRLMNR